MCRIRGSGGFTLMEIIVAVAIVSLMAGALGPVAYKQINSARTRATAREMEILEAGLLSFYEDTGRFPTEGEGLSALVVDPGAPNWQGPYVAASRRNPVESVRDDAFGREYVYDFNPLTTPPGSADLIVASTGADPELNAGGLNRNWDLNQDVDDLLVLVSAAGIDRAKENETRAELEAVASACRDYFQDHAGFPPDLSPLVGIYLDPGFDNGALRDAWNNQYRLLTYASGEGILILRVYSTGPDRQDDQGADDDLYVPVSSVPPGRRTTRLELDIAQTVLNCDPELELTSQWAGPGGVRARLGLADIFDLDGWGNVYGINVNSRIVYSCGADGDPASISDNLPRGVGP
ncbi:MAG: type II secretion system protein GspG [Candidatus Krumholzibacteriota bacterium]|nr:type II secretion system protein GspG [Candidatus Krumholzibacteriota bacterium]